MALFTDSAPAGLDYPFLPVRDWHTSARRAALPMSEEERDRAAAAIDAKVIELESQGFRDVALLSLMVDHALDFHRLMHGVLPERRHELLLRHVGLRRFGVLLARARAALPDW